MKYENDTFRASHFIPPCTLKMHDFILFCLLLFGTKPASNFLFMVQDTAKLKNKRFGPICSSFIALGVFY